MVDYSPYTYILNHMAEYNIEHAPEQLDAVFHALADKTRRGMLMQLSVGPQTVSALAEPYAMSLAAASKHIKKLEAAHLVRRDVQGRTHTCHLDAAVLAKANEWIQHYERFWATRLDALEAALTPQ